MSVLQVHDDFDTNDIVLRAQISDLVLVMAPRVFLVLSQLIMSDVRMPQKLRAVSSFLAFLKTHILNQFLF